MGHRITSQHALCTLHGGCQCIHSMFNICTYVYVIYTYMHIYISGIYTHDNIWIWELDIHMCASILLLSIYTYIYIWYMYRCVSISTYVNDTKRKCEIATVTHSLCVHMSTTYYTHIHIYYVTKIVRDPVSHFFFVVSSLSLSCLVMTGWYCSSEVAPRQSLLLFVAMLMTESLHLTCRF